MGGGVAIHQPDDRAGQESAQDRLEPELLRQGDECDEQYDGRPDPDLGRGVLQPHQYRSDPLGTSGGRDHDAGDDHEDGEQSDHDEPLAGAPAFGREHERQHQYGGEVGDRGRGDGELADRALGFARVLEHRYDQTE